MDHVVRVFTDKGSYYYDARLCLQPGPGGTILRTFTLAARR